MQCTIGDVSVRVGFLQHLGEAQAEVGEAEVPDMDQGPVPSERNISWRRY